MPKNSPQTITGSSVYPAEGGKQTESEQLRGAEGRTAGPVHPVSFYNCSISGITAVFVLLLLSCYDLRAVQCGRMLESDM